MLTPGSAVGPYQIASRIGQGGMGEVFKAHDSRLGRDVAVKISKEAFSARFTRPAIRDQRLHIKRAAVSRRVDQLADVAEALEHDRRRFGIPLASSAVALTSRASGRRC